MSFTNWLRNLRSCCRPDTSTRRSRRAARSGNVRRFRPQLEVLEDRAVPSAYVVDSLTDTGAGSGLAGDLRYCVTHATSGNDTIALGVTGTIDLNSALPALNTSVAIQGPGASQVTVERAQSNFTSFGIFAVGSAANVQISGLTIANANVGAIHNAGTLTVNASTLSGNSSYAGPGGAIYNTGTLTVSNSTLSWNSAIGEGGAIYDAGGTLTLDHCTLSGNETYGTNGYVFFATGFSGGSAAGGGVYVAGGMVYVNQSTFSSNQAVGGTGNPADACTGVSASDGNQGEGGGLYVAGGKVSIDNSTFSANTARGGLGGAGETCTDGPFGNNSPPGNGGPAAGGGIRVAAGTVEVHQSTLSGNSATGGLGGAAAFYGDPPGANGVGVGGGINIAPAAPPLADLDTYTESNTINNFADIDPNIAGPYSLNGTSTQPSTFTVSGFPSSTTAGVAGSFTVTAKNADGSIDTGYTGAVHFTSSDSQAGLPTDYAFTAADGGVHTFSATLKTAGTQSLTATDTQTASVTGAESGIIVNPAATSHFGVSAPAGSMAGSAFSLTLAARDPYGNTATGYTGTVHFASTDGQANLPGDYTFTAADAGVHAFTNGMTLKTAGSQSITATDTVSNSITGNSAVTVSPATASAMTVAGFPSSTTAGAGGNFTITLKDPFGNIASGYAGTVHFTSSDPKATLPANYTFTPADAGKHTFSATLKTADTQSITATDTLTGSLTATESGIMVSAAAASKFIISAPSNVSAGVAFSLTLTVKDAYGNVVSGYTGTVHFGSTDHRATLPADYTFTAADKGVHTFTGLVLRKRGTQKITLTDTLNSSLTGSVIENVL